MAEWTASGEVNKCSVETALAHILRAQTILADRHRSSARHEARQIREEKSLLRDENPFVHLPARLSCLPGALHSLSWFLTARLRRRSGRAFAASASHAQPA